MEQSRAWTDQLLTSPEHLPFSFTYGGRLFAGLPLDWHPRAHHRRFDANLVETAYEGNDAATGLSVRIECLQYQDFPVVEWTVWFSNQGDEPTPLLQNILALDSTFRGASPVLWHCNGDYYSQDGYTPTETPLQDRVSLAFAPTGGRPCDRAFPYFRVQFEDSGLTLAVGWPAQWAAEFVGAPNGIHVTAGQEMTNLRLLPGETIRTPRITVMSWRGDAARAVNLWRRWYLCHVLPKPDGRPLRPKLACAATDTGEEFTQATEANQIAYMDKFVQAGLSPDVWWIDAGWYPCRDEQGVRRWPRTGTWKPDPERFPRGFWPVARRAAEHGAGLLVWFEPERVTIGSQLDREHPEWLLSVADRPDGTKVGNKLLNLGNLQCRQWLTDHICRLIAENGIGIYRQDFNFEPLRYWRENEEADRQGILENLHVQGYLQFWDDLLRRNPGLWIDSCASGGRRNDLETMRRAVPLHYSDYGYGEHAVKLAFQNTLYAWIPYFKDATVSWDLLDPVDDKRWDKQVDSYSMHCGMAPMMFTTVDIRRDDYDLSLAVKMAGIWRRAAKIMLHGDYYPLTPFSKSPERWVVRQFSLPENDTGLVQGIRHRNCPEESIVVFPQGIRENRTYVLENPETLEKREIAGSALLADGFCFRLPRRSAAIWFYRAKNTLPA
jgi:alpha-galactosidase